MDVPKIISGLRAKCRNIKRSHDRLVLKAKLKAEEMCASLRDGSGMQKLLQKAFSYLGNNKLHFTNEIINSTLRVLTTMDQTSTSSEVQHFSSYISEQLVHMGNRICDKGTQQRYSPHVLRVALGIWSRSNGAFKHLQESNIAMFPSQRTLHRRRKQCRGHQGYDPNIYSRMFDNFKREGGKFLVI